MKKTLVGFLLAGVVIPGTLFAQSTSSDLQIQAILQQIQALQAELYQLQNSGNTGSAGGGTTGTTAATNTTVNTGFCLDLKSALIKGSSGADVARLQYFLMMASGRYLPRDIEYSVNSYSIKGRLIESNLWPANVPKNFEYVTGYFGDKTEIALTDFQWDYNIFPRGARNGTLTDATRAKIKELTCGGTSTNPVTPPVTQITNKFKIGDDVQTTANVNVRPAPTIGLTLSNTVLGTQSFGAQGKVIGGPIQASGYTWWNVDFTNTPDGWVAENNLVVSTVVTGTVSPSVVLLSKSIIRASAPTGKEALSAQFNVRVTAGTNDIQFATGANNFSIFQPGGFNIYKDGVLTKPNVNTVIDFSPPSTLAYNSATGAYTIPRGQSITFSVSFTMEGVDTTGAALSAGKYSVELYRIFHLSGLLLDNASSASANSSWATSQITFPNQNQVGAPTVDLKVNGSDGPITVPHNSQVNITWTSTGAITSCDLVAKVTSTFSFLNVGASGSKTTGNLTNPQEVATILCNNGVVLDSVTINVSTPQVPPPVGGSNTIPATPASINASTSSTCGGKINISWGSVANATSYKLYRYPSNTPIYTGPNTSFTDSVIEYSGQRYEVVASNSAGDSVRTPYYWTSATATGSGFCTSPTVSIGANVSTISSGGSATLSWSLSNTANSSCSASASPANSQWNGAKSASGSQTISNITQNTVFTFLCNFPGGTSSNSVAVNITGSTNTSGSPFTLLYPRGGESISFNQPLTVRWNTNGYTGSQVDVSIYEATRNCCGIAPVATQRVSNTGTATFQSLTGFSCFGSAQCYGKNMIVRISCVNVNSCTSTDSGTFSIGGVTSSNTLDPKQIAAALEAVKQLIQALNIGS